MNLDRFLEQFKKSKKSLDILEKRKILRLLVKEVLVESEGITIKHVIPMGSPYLRPITQNTQVSGDRSETLFEGSSQHGNLFEEILRSM